MSTSNEFENGREEHLRRLAVELTGTLGRLEEKAGLAVELMTETLGRLDEEVGHRRLVVEDLRETNEAITRLEEQLRQCKEAVLHGGAPTSKEVEEFHRQQEENLAYLKAQLPILENNIRCGKHFAGITEQAKRVSTQLRQANQFNLFDRKVFKGVLGIFKCAKPIHLDNGSSR